MSFARNWIYVAVAVAVALGVHAATLFALPHFIMTQAMNKITPGHIYNVVRHMPRADEHSRLVVRPSPDLLYSACAFDLSKGALRVTAEVPPGTYWSVSVFDANTNNIFVENDRQAKGGKVDFDIVGHGSGIVIQENGNNAPYTIEAPRPIKGLVLFRTLIIDESRFAAIDAARRKVTCGVDTNVTHWELD